MSYTIQDFGPDDLLTGGVGKNPGLSPESITNVNIPANTPVTIAVQTQTGTGTARAIMRMRERW